MTFKRTRCAHCRDKFAPERANQIVHPECAEAYVVAQRDKADRAEARAQRAASKLDKAETRRRLEAMKRIPELIADAQVAFNAFIRARDAGLPCICCGKPFEPQKPGGSADAGHFRSRGAASALRFNTDNCFAQRKNCNRPGGTTYAAFRAGVVARIGLDRVEALESNNAVHKWEREELRAIKADFKARLKEITKTKEGATA